MDSKFRCFLWRAILLRSRPNPIHLQAIHTSSDQVNCQNAILESTACVLSCQRSCNACATGIPVELVTPSGPPTGPLCQLEVSDDPLRCASVPQILKSWEWRA